MRTASVLQLFLAIAILVPAHASTLNKNPSTTPNIPRDKSDNSTIRSLVVFGDLIEDTLQILVQNRLIKNLSRLFRIVQDTSLKLSEESVLKSVQLLFKQLVSFAGPKSKRESATMAKKVYSELRYFVNNFNDVWLKFATTNVTNMRVEFGKRNASRAMRMSVSRLLQIMLLPALVMTGIMPFVLPPLKMAVMMSTAITNMAFMAALGSLIRNYIFEPDLSKIVKYKNYGWKEDRRKETMNHRK
ncbi:hypothetical protein CBL_12469 [Carabus blaptoides fortunei]